MRKDKNEKGWSLEIKDNKGKTVKKIDSCDAIVILAHESGVSYAEVDQATVYSANALTLWSMKESVKKTLAQFEKYPAVNLLDEIKAGITEKDINGNSLYKIIKEAEKNADEEDREA